eukprot:jgi/Bigna1/90403/estExt_fgenesh1_pg.C_700007
METSGFESTAKEIKGFYIERTHILQVVWGKHYLETLSRVDKKKTIIRVVASSRNPEDFCFCFNLSARIYGKHGERKRESDSREYTKMETTRHRSPDLESAEPVDVKGQSGRSTTSSSRDSVEPNSMVPAAAGKQQRTTGKRTLDDGPVNLSREGQALFFRASTRDSMRCTLASLDCLINFRSSEDGYVKRIQELGERKEKVLLNIKEIRRTLSQLNDEIKGMSDLSTTTTCNTKAQDGISSSTVQQQYTHDIETCRRIKASMDVQKSAIEQQIKDNNEQTTATSLLLVLSKKRDNNPHLFRQLSKISRQRQVLAISDDGFPRTPPRGTVFVHYDDGYIEVIANCTPLDKAEYEEKYGLEQKGYFAQKRNEVAEKRSTGVMTEVRLEEAGNTTSSRIIKRNTGRHCMVS